LKASRIGSFATLSVVRVLHALDVLFGFLDTGANPQPDEDEDGAEEERDAPTPGEEILGGEVAAEQGHEPGGQEQSEGIADLNPTGVEGAQLRRCAFDGHERGASPFSADRNALNAAQQDEQCRCQPADRLVGRQTADERGGHAHDRHRPDEHGLAPETVAEVAEDDSAERAEDESDAEGRERRERARSVTVAGEEELAEDQSCDDPVEQEVIPFDDGADKRPGRRTACTPCPSRFDCRLVFDIGHRFLP
jgi:hypothetical protein